jgi:molecular chaperone DnaK (HSP70)
MDLFMRTLNYVDQALKDAKMTKLMKVNEIILVGGSTRIPKF